MRTHTRRPLRALTIAITMALTVPALALAQSADPRDTQHTGHHAHQQQHAQQQHAQQQQQQQTQRHEQQREQQITQRTTTQRGMYGLQERPGQAVGDARREAVIWTTLATNPNLRETGIDVEVRGNTAILRGDVESRVERELAEDLARSVEGITRVDNRLNIDAQLGARTATTIGGDRTLRDRDRDTVGERRGERDFGTAISDATTTAQIKSRLLWNQQTSGMDINVDTWHGRVTLSGEVDSQAERQLAERLARDTGNVVSVDNQLRVGGTAAAAAATDTRVTTDARDRDAFAGRTEGTFAGQQDRTTLQGQDDRDLRAQQDRRIDDRDLRAQQDRRVDQRDPVTDRTTAAAQDTRAGDQRFTATERDARESDQPVNDAWITTKVRSTLLFSRNVESGNIDVETNNGVVRLSGSVDNPAARQIAIDLTRDIRGVRNVDASALTVTADRVAGVDEDDR